MFQRNPSGDVLPNCSPPLQINWSSHEMHTHTVGEKWTFAADTQQGLTVHDVSLTYLQWGLWSPLSSLQHSKLSDMSLLSSKDDDSTSTLQYNSMCTCN